MLVIQIIGAVFAFFMIYHTYILYKKKDFEKEEMILWILGWIAFFSASIYPNVFSGVASVFDLTRTMDLFMIVGFMIVLFSLFNVYSSSNKTKKKLENLVRKLANENITKNKK